MRTETSETESSIGKRAIRAATESMTIVPIDDGRFKVWSGTNAEPYTVDLMGRSCDCPDDPYAPPAGCKHLQRVEMQISLRSIPDLGARRLDVEVMREAHERTHHTGAKRVMADGGQLLEAEPQGESEETTHAPGCDNPECEGFDADGRPLLSFECWDARQEERR